MNALRDMLTWQTGFLLVAALSAVAAFMLIRLRSGTARWAVAFIAPIVFSYCLYWLPVWLGYEDTNSGEVAHWAPIFIVPWALLGAAVAMGIMLIAGRRRKGSA